MILRKVGDAWSRFWFEPQATSALAAFRIGLGVLCLSWGLAFLPDLGSFFTTDGIEPVPVDVTWGILGHFTSDAAVYSVYVGFMMSAAAFTVGFRTRIASVVMFVTLFSLIERAPSIFNSGDALLRNLAFFAVFMPAGESLSVDRWRRHRDAFWEFPERARWALRLVQVQVSVLYLSAAHHKIADGSWLDGTALSYAWRMDDIVRFPMPDFVSTAVPVSVTLSFLTVAVELLIGIFVWSKSARPMVLALGVGLHLGIDLTLRVGFFSWAILAAYVAFLSPETASKLALRVRDAWEARSVRRTTAESQLVADQNG